MATVYATTPSRQKVQVNVNAAGKTTSNLPVGSVVHTAGGDYKITGGSAGNYTSTKVSDSGYSDVGASAPTPSGYNTTSYSDVGSSGSRSSGGSSTNAGTAASIVQATLPGGQQIQVSVVNGKTITPNLPKGTIIHTAGGNYTITGGSAGAYTSAPASSFTPSVAGGSSATSALPGAAQGLFNTPVLPSLESNYGNLRGVESITGGATAQPSVTDKVKQWLNTPLPGVAQPAEGTIPFAGLGGVASNVISQFKPTVGATPTPTMQHQESSLPLPDIQSLQGQAGGQGTNQIYPTGYNVPNTMTPTTGNTMSNPSGTYSANGTFTPAGTGTMTQTPTVATTAQMPFDPEQMKQEMYAAIDAAAQQNAVLATTWMNNMISTLDQLQSQIQQQYTQMGSTLDPATTAALKQIRDDVEQRRQTLMEEMNRRGLLQSGIWLTEENKILNNQMTAEETLLANRLSDLQNRLVDSMMQFAQQRINIMGTAAQNSLSNQQWAGSQKISALSDINQRVDQWNQWWAEQQAAAKEAAQKQSNWQAEYDLNKQKAEQTNALGWAKLQQAQSQAGNNSATKQFLNQIPGYGSLEEALADFNRYQSLMAAQGADTNLIQQAIYGFFGQ